MVARGAGDVGCAHCTVIGAVVSCQVCTRQVCESCAADWTTCAEPTGREVRLGRTARLRDVDPLGHIGLVTRWGRSMRLFDVRRLRWIDVAMPKHTNTPGGEIIDRLTSTGRLWHPVWTSVADQTAFSHMEVRSLADGQWTSVFSDAPWHSATVTEDDTLYYVTESMLVVMIASDNTVRTFEPLQRRVAQAVYVSSANGLMATGTWGEIVLHRIVGDALKRVGNVSIEGNVSWIALEEPWLAACVEDTVRVWHVGANLAIGREEYTHVVGNKWKLGSLSRDGRYLALGIDEKVLVHALDTDVITQYDDYTDDLCLVRFAGTDHMLVTADTDNRVVLRPRSPAGYVRSKIEIDVPEEPVALELEHLEQPR